MQGLGYRPATMHHRHIDIGYLSCLKLLVQLHANRMLCQLASGMNALLCRATVEVPLLADLQACQVLLDSIWHLCQGIAA